MRRADSISLLLSLLNCNAMKMSCQKWLVKICCFSILTGFFFFFFKVILLLMPVVMVRTEKLHADQSNQIAWLLYNRRETTAVPSWLQLILKPVYRRARWQVRRCGECSVLFSLHAWLKFLAYCYLIIYIYKSINLFIYFDILCIVVRIASYFLSYSNCAL